MEQGTPTEPAQAGHAPPSALRELADDPSSRKRFLRMAGGASVGTALSLAIAACGSRTAGPVEKPAPSIVTRFGQGDLGILNYALTLELFEREFYKKTLETDFLSGKTKQLFQVIYQHEQEHVDAVKALVEQFAGDPVPMPRANYPLNSERNILNAAATFENLGASAYLGAAGAITDKSILAAALSIHTVEARHAASLNQIVGIEFTPDGAFAKPKGMEEVLNAVKTYLET